MGVYLDSGLDIAFISELSHHERAAFKPVYSMNKWWARRSSSAFRAILLALALQPDGNLKEQFYQNHQADLGIRQRVILDPFMGGGTTAVEALRLGYKVIGVDLNPLAWFIVRTETTQVDLDALENAFSRLERRVANAIRAMYVTECPCCGGEAEAVYSFWVKVARCATPGCGHEVPLFRDYVVGQRRGQAALRYYEESCPNCRAAFDVELDRATVVPNSEDQATTSAVQSQAPGRPWSYRSESGLVTCPACGIAFASDGSNRKLATKKAELFALICPECWSLFPVRGPVPDIVRCSHCEHDFNPHHGSTDRGLFTCPDGHENTITEEAMQRLDGEVHRQNGDPWGFRLYAIEGYCPHCAEERVCEQQSGQSRLPGLQSELSGGEARPAEDCSRCRAVNHKFFKRPDAVDLQRYASAVQTWERTKEGLPWPREPIQDYEKTNRLIIHNYRYWHQLFNPRQLLALSWMLQAILDEPDQLLKETLLSAFLGTLEHQNMLNIYHVPYAQSAGAFGRHDFHPKVMACEGNPWGGRKGRGTFLMVFGSTRAGKRYLLEPYDPMYLNGKRANVYSGDAFSGRMAEGFADLIDGDANLLLRAQDSRDLSFIPDGSVWQAVTDPPYADSVQYAELADFFYVWLRTALKGDYPRLFAAEETPKAEEIVENQRRQKSQAEFYAGLTDVFRECWRVLRPKGQLVFTFHHSCSGQWADLLTALHDAGFRLAAAYPVHSEATGSGNLVFHSNARSIAYDMILSCKKVQADEQVEAIARMDLRAAILNQVLRDVEAIRVGKNYDQRLTDDDVRTMLWGACLAVYSRHYGRVLDDQGQVMEMITVLDQAASLVEEVMDRQPKPQGEPV